MAKKKKTAAGKVAVRFNAEPQHVLDADGVEIRGGDVGLVDAETAETLIHADWTDVTLADQPSWPRSHDELDKLAAKFDVELPAVSAAGGQPKPTVSEKIAALEAAGFTPADAATASVGGTASDAESGEPDTKEGEA